MSRDMPDKYGTFSTEAGHPTNGHPLDLLVILSGGLLDCVPTQPTFWHAGKSPGAYKLHYLGPWLLRLVRGLQSVHPPSHTEHGLCAEPQLTRQHIIHHKRPPCLQLPKQRPGHGQRHTRHQASLLYTTTPPRPHRHAPSTASLTARRRAVTWPGTSPSSPACRA